MKLEHANKIIQGALAKGAETGCAPLAIVVLDTGGHIIAVQREDGASIKRPEIAMGKARGALALGVSSRKIGEVAAERPQFIASLSATLEGQLIPAAGGLLVMDSVGELIGAVGISGDVSDKDEVCTYAGIEAASLKPG